MAFAVISVVIGYLFAQVTAFLLADTSLWSGITVNYSSLSGVGAMSLVIVVVLVSVIYPSKVAGEIAIPDVNRSWKLPEVEGHVLDLTLPFLTRWGGLGIGVVLLLAIDLAGSTPLYKSWLHDDRRYQVVLEAEQCIGCRRCAQVCPRGVFAVEEIAALPHADRCEQCGACIVQCPTDALAFLIPSGERIPPETIRRYKLNLMGHREQPSA